MSSIVKVVPERVTLTVFGASVPAYCMPPEAVELTIAVAWAWE